MKNVLSFSLFGGDPIYTLGCIKNAELHKTIFKDWEMRVYHSSNLNTEILNRLRDLGVVLVKEPFNEAFGTMWRFLPASEQDEGFFISRDCDSRISLRDEIAVKEWMLSGKKYHIIREHPVGHNWAMNAGMWGCKKGSVDNIRDLILNYCSNNNSGKFTDQYFLESIIYPTAKKDSLIHDEFYNIEGIGKRIERDRHLDDYAFIGESLDENDVPRGDQRTLIRQRYNQ